MLERRADRQAARGEFRFSVLYRRAPSIRPVTVKKFFPYRKLSGPLRSIRLSSAQPLTIFSSFAFKSILTEYLAYLCNKAASRWDAQRRSKQPLNAPSGRSPDVPSVGPSSARRPHPLCVDATADIREVWCCASQESEMDGPGG